MQLIPESGSVLHRQPPSRSSRPMPTMKQSHAGS
jgi:hypothetical protein